MAASASAVAAIFCEIAPRRSGSSASRRDPPRLVSAAEPSPEGGKILLQPRLCTLRSYGSGDRDLVIRTAPRSCSEVTPFFASLAHYVDSSRKSQDFEIVSGRLAMIVFATTVTVEAVTGDTLFKKLDLQQIAGAGGACVAVVAFAAAFAWASSARNRINQMFTIGCNSFVDSLIDNLVDGLFYESELEDWSDEM